MSIEVWLTVVTVTYRDHAGLVSTLRSVSSQNLIEGVEHLVIDAEASDEVRKLCNDSMHSVTYLGEHDKGIYDGMNKGFSRAKGRLVQFLNSGDTFTDVNATEAIRNISLLYPKVAVYYFDSSERTANGKRIIKKARGIEAIRLGMFAHHQAMVFNFNEIEECRYDQTLKIAADYALVSRLYINGKNFFYSPMSLIEFQGMGVSWSEYKIGRTEALAVQREILSCSFFELFISRFRFFVSMMIRRVAPSVWWWLRN